MKLETLARRLAEKTGTPALERIILEGGDLPPDCMVWTGGAKGRGEKIRPWKRRDRQNHPYLSFYKERPYAVMNWQGSSIAVHRLIFQLVSKPDYQFRMVCQCPTPLCVNPLHWEVQKIDPDAEPEPETGPVIVSGDWTLEEVTEIVEVFLTEYEPKTWDDVVSAPLMEGVPLDLVRQVLTDMNKEYLLWT